MTPLSMRREKTSASPPRIMVLMEPPMKLTISRQTSMESGTASKTATVARGLPRKTRIMTPVITSPMTASRVTLAMASLTKTD